VASYSTLMELTELPLPQET